MKIKKSFLVALFALAAMFIFAACGGGGDDAPAATPAPDVAATPAPATDDATTDDNDTADAAPVAAGRERTELSVLTWSRGGDGYVDSADNYFTNWIHERLLEELNMYVTFTSIGRWNEHEDIITMFLSNEVPDLAMSWNGGMVSTFGRQGGIMDLAPLLQENLPNLPYLESWLDDLLWQNEDPATGEIFSIMQRRVHVPRTGTFIRADWLETLGLPLPTTTEEFVDALRAFRDNADLLGVPTMIPLAMTEDVRWRASTLLESFIDPNLTDYELFSYFIGDRHLLLPGYREGVRLLNQMFNEGLVDPDFVLHDGDETSDNLVVAGFVGAYIHNWDNLWRANPDVMNRLRENDPNARFVPIDPFVNPTSGVTNKFSYETGGFHVFIPTQSRNPVGALEYLDWMSQLENRLYIQLGEVGYHHELVNLDGHDIPVALPVDPHSDRRIYSPQNIDLTLVVNGVDLGNADANALTFALGFPGIEPQLVVDSYNIALTNARQMPVIPIYGGLPFNADFAPTFQQMASTALSMSIVAPVDQFDAVWEQQIANILAAGAQQAINERRAGLGID